MTLPAPVTRALHHRLAQVQREARLPSLAAATARRGAEPFWTGIGRPEPGADTQYRIGSITKTFTAVLVMQLRDEGRLRLDDPVGEYVPGTPVGHLLVRELLGHSSGLRREPEGSFWEASPGHSAQALLRELREQDALLPSRRAWHYSNLAFGLLGLAVEHLREAPYRQVLRRHVLDPLGLTRTTYLSAPPHAVGLRVHPFCDAVTEEPVHDSRAMAPAGQLWSTPGDLCRWGQFLADPVQEVLAPATVEEMCHPVVMVDPDAWTGGAGLGLQLFRQGDRVFVGHGGSMPGFLAGLAVSRPEGVVAAVCANAWQAMDAAELACGLVADVLDGDPQPGPVWEPADLPAGMEDLLGLWWWRGVAFVAFVAEGVLHLGPGRDRLGARPTRFEPAGRDEFVGVSGMNHGERLRVRRDDQGCASHLEIATFILTRDLDDPRGGP